jgi:hypothetical protein
MSMAVCALGHDGDYVDAVEEKASAWLPQKKSFALCGLCWHRLWCVDVGENYI